MSNVAQIRSAFFALAFGTAAAWGATIHADQLEFFEKKIRPVLAQECYECHSTQTKSKGGLTLDTRAGWQEGGNTGPVIVPGDVQNSLLLQSIRHEDPELKMPKAGAKLDAATLRDFEAWVKMGAPDPRDKAPTPQQLAADTAWPQILERRKSWWSFQPVQSRPVPALPLQPENPIDAFLQEKRAVAGLASVEDADPATLCRRLYLVLTGLPPAPEDSAAFEATWKADRSAAVAKTTDALLASPRFGERWARHWMDWVRYAETHGSEGDPAIPFAWRYRDYLIRALNADVPYPQLVREHIAGDLLTQPRINKELGLNESAIGTAQLRMVLHGFTPTDAHDELVTFTDNQIDTVSKAFLGITLSCARCHNHKFDPISQADFYSWYGIFTSGRPALIDVNTQERKLQHLGKLQELKSVLRDKLASVWLADVDTAVANLAAEKDPKKLLEPAFQAWTLVSGAGDNLGTEWQKALREFRDDRAKLEAFRAQASYGSTQFATPNKWVSDGPALASNAYSSGEFLIEPQGDKVVANVLPARAVSSVYSTRHRGVLTSPPMQALGGKLWVRVRGGKATARYVVRNYPRSGLVYPKQEINTETDQWFGWDLAYWKGDVLHFELTTEGDHPVETNNMERSWFAIAEMQYLADENVPAPRIVEGSLFALSDEPAPTNVAELSTRYAESLRRSILNWRANAKMSDDEAEFLAAFVRRGLLKNTLNELTDVAPLVNEYRKFESGIPLPTRVPGVIDAFASDQPLYTRGDHKKPAEIVARHFLDALDNKPFALQGHASGRLQLAESIAAPSNPLAPRVIVNRLWHHTFGRGIFPTPDNTGRLGELPSHPELLDFLAARFQSDGGSIKSALRLLVTSRAFRQGHRASEAALTRDPDNRLLTRYVQRRMDAETLRDSLIVLTGKLDANLGGPPVDGGALRRSVYTRVVRNDLDPFLSAFDFPVPAAPRGARDVTNVPAQSLALLNSPLISRWALDWARRVRNDARFTTDEARVQRMLAEAYARTPAEAELRDALAFVRVEAEAKITLQAELSAAEAIRNEDRTKVLREQLKQASQPEYALGCLAHVLINTKEFLYVR